jgi:hypothetical protein
MNTFRYPNGRIIPINGSNFSRLLLILINFLLKPIHSLSLLIAVLLLLQYNLPLIIQLLNINNISCNLMGERVVLGQLVHDQPFVRFVLEIVE